MQVSIWIIDRRLENGPVMLPTKRLIEETDHSFESTILNPILTAMVYCVRENKVLLLRRAKEPMKGLWVAPGGKIEPGESPWQCANRELQEETGLQASGLILRGIISETSPRPDWQWLIFIYVAKETSGQMIGKSDEGELWPAPFIPIQLL